FGGRRGVVDGEATMTFGELAGRVREAGSAVAAAGIERGDRVAIWAPNVWEWIVAALGTLSAGATLVPINTRFKGEEAAYILDKSDAKLLFTICGFLDTDYVGMLRATGMNVDTVILRGDAPPGTAMWKAFLERGGRSTPAAPEPGDLSDVIFTSGTTGRPKGVMTTHAQTLRVFEVWSRVVGLREGDRYLIVNP